MIFSVSTPCQTKRPSKLNDLPAWAEHPRTVKFLPLCLACHLIHFSFTWRSHRQLGRHQVDLLHIRCGLATPATLQTAAKNIQAQRTCGMVGTCGKDPTCEKKLTSWPGPFKNGRQTRCQNNMSPSRHPLCCDLGVCSWLCLSCPQAKRRSRAWALLAERKETEGDPLKKCMCTQKTLLCWMFATRNLVFLGVFATKTCDLFLMFATNTCDLFLMVATKNCDLFGCLPLKTWIYDLSMRELDWAGNFPVRVGILPAPERKIPPPTDFKSIDSPLSKASRVVFNIRVRN